MRKTLINLWRRSPGAGGACCEGERCATPCAPGANECRALTDACAAARFILFGSGALTVAVVGICLLRPAQHSKHERPPSTKAALFAPLSDSAAPSQSIPACEPSAWGSGAGASSCVAATACACSVDSECGAFDSSNLARQQSCSSDAGDATANALASSMQHAAATAASAPPHTPAVSVRSKPKLRASRRINLSEFSLPNSTFRSSSI